MIGVWSASAHQRMSSRKLSSWKSYDQPLLPILPSPVTKIVIRACSACGSECLGELGLLVLKVPPYFQIEKAKKTKEINKKSFTKLLDHTKTKIVSAPVFFRPVREVQIRWNLKINKTKSEKDSLESGPRVHSDR